EASLSLLDDPGITCFSQHAVQRLSQAGCRTSSIKNGSDAWRIRFPPDVVEQSLEATPRRIVLGARNPANTLLLDSQLPVVYFGTGSEANIYLETEMAEFVRKDDPSSAIFHPIFSQKRGSVGFLCQSAKLCNQLGQVDFFIRNVNIQDDGITPDNKDVNVFLAALMYMTKHVQSGLTQLDRLDDVLKLAEMVAGGPERLKKNPIVSFITCLIKSPLQMVEDTTEKLITIAERGLPVVISSSPQGGSTAPIQEEGMVTLINAEILAGITLTQVVNPGTPVLYGAVPVRARLDTLHDLYGAPEFIHYNTDCVQMARHYGIPCYSTAGVGDAKVPGLQATVEKLFAYLYLGSSGAQYIHYAFGLLDKTNVFSPLQAVLDDAHIGIVRQILREPEFGREETENAVEEIRKVTGSRTKLFARHIRKWIKKGLVSPPYPFESGDEEDRVMEKAYHRLQEILQGPDEKLTDELIQKIHKKIPGLLPVQHFELKGK
ncbi:MAG: trimethylamine methyltransferase family protein, partial [Candidatus Aminicenantes bacterium]